MTVRRIDQASIALKGQCPIEDADALTQLLIESPEAVIDWRGCDRLHAAVLQVLLIARPALLGPPRGRILAEHIAPSLATKSAT